MQDKDELIEMRSLVKEMKSLNDRNNAMAKLFAQAGQARHDNTVDHVSQLHVVEGVNFTDQPDLNDISHEQVVTTEQLLFEPECDGVPAFANPHDYGWETDDDNETVSEPIESQVMLLQRIMSKQSVQLAAAAALSKAPLANTTVEVSVSETSQIEPNTRCTFKLSEELQEGALQAELY